MANVISKGLSRGEYLRLMALEDVNVFEKIIEWEEQDYVNLESLLNQLDIVNDAKESKTTDKVKVLEDIARYVIDKTFFLRYVVILKLLQMKLIKWFCLLSMESRLCININ